MKKIRAAIVGYGNIGKYVLEALEAAPDFEVAGVVRRNPNDIPDELKGYAVTDTITKLDKVDVAVLATPTRSVETYAKEILSLGINTVDSFDIHGGIVDLRRSLDAVAKAHNTVAVISAGWDPGSDSIVRALLQAIVPKGITGVHRRMVYIEVEEGYDFEKVAAAIKADDYFVHDETHVIQVDCVDDLKDMGHGVNLVRKGVSGKTQNQLIELPVIDMLYGEREDLIKKLV